MLDFNEYYKNNKVSRRERLTFEQLIQNNNNHGNDGFNDVSSLTSNTHPKNPNGNLPKTNTHNIQQHITQTNT